MTSDTRSVWEDVRDIVGAGTERTANAVVGAIGRYWHFLWNWLGRLALVGVVTMIVLVGLAMGESVPVWIFSAGSLLLGGLGIAALVLSAPLLWAIGVAQDTPVVGPEIRRLLRLITTTAFLTVALAIAAQLLPLWQNPAQLLLVILVFAGLALGSQVGLVMLPRKYVATLFTVGLLVVLAGAIVKIGGFSLSSIASTPADPGTVAVPPRQPAGLDANTRLVVAYQEWSPVVTVPLGYKVVWERIGTLVAFEARSQTGAVRRWASGPTEQHIAFPGRLSSVQFRAVDADSVVLAVRITPIQ